MRWLALAVAVLAAGCLRTTTFNCTTNAECATGGTCQTDVGFCSFPDLTCAGGSRFGEFSGSFSGTCVGGPAIDGGIDGPDAAPDAFVCPAAYTPLSGAPHVYRLIGTAAQWQTQKSACASDGGHLAIPDDAGELTAIITLNGANDLWVGLTDSATEGTFLTVLGAGATFLPWDTGQPDNAPGNADCVRSNPAGKFADDRCSTSLRAVCECE